MGNLAAGSLVERQADQCRQLRQLRVQLCAADLCGAPPTKTRMLAVHHALSQTVSILAICTAG